MAIFVDESQSRIGPHAHRILFQVDSNRKLVTAGNWTCLQGSPAMSLIALAKAEVR